MQDAGLYVHIPFCQKKCRYCSFYSEEHCLTDEKLYLEALKKHLSTFSIPENLHFSSLYFGGGTPSILSPVFYEKCIEILIKETSIVTPAEITLEANPEHCTLEQLRNFHSAGINRVSIGFQSNQSVILKKLGRIHSLDTAIQAVLNACEVFDNVSCDFMIGIKNQSISVSSLFKVPFLNNIQHVSLYILEGEKNHSLFQQEDMSADLYEQCCCFLEDNQFHQYEISNFARKDFRSKHNMHYWNMNPYIGLGPSAHSFISKTRSHESSSLKNFINHRFSKEMVQYSEDELAKEALMLSLRTIDGADVTSLSNQFDFVYSPVLKTIFNIFPDYINATDNIIKLNRKGFLISNEIFEKILFE